MKVAVISDIHSNYEALNAVLEDIASRNCEKIICLGDLVGYGPKPNEVLEKLINLEMFIVMGNYDEAVGFYLPYCGCHIDSEKKLMQSKNSLNWTSENTKEEYKEFLRKLPEELVLKWDGKTIFAAHASPSSITEYIYRHHEERLIEVIKEVNEDMTVDILLFGHTHYPFIYCRDGKVVLNPGSVGKPKDGDSRASYAVLEIGATVKAEVVRVSYDIEKVVEDINRTSLLKEFGTMLRLGKMI